MMRRISEWFDSPRFCPDCGDPIEVVNLGAFDPQSGKPTDRWVWKCPDVMVEIGDSGTYAEQWGVNRIHAWGRGRPRWYTALASEDRPRYTEDDPDWAAMVSPINEKDVCHDDR